MQRLTTEVAGLKAEVARFSDAVKERDVKVRVRILRGHHPRATPALSRCCCGF